MNEIVKKRVSDPTAVGCGICTDKDDDLLTNVCIREEFGANASRNPDCPTEVGLSGSLDSKPGDLSVKLFTTSPRCLAVMSIPAIVIIAAFHIASSLGIVAMSIVAICALTFVASISS